MGGQLPEDHGQDLTDFFVKHKKNAVDLQRLIDNADYFTAPDPGIEPQALSYFEVGVNGRMSFKPHMLAKGIMEKFKLLFCPDTGLLYRWNGRYWEEFFEAHLRAVAIEMLGKEAKQGWINDAVFQVLAMVTMPHGRSLNDNLDYICVKNGMLNITTGILEDHDPNFYASYVLPVSYNPDSKDRCDRFLQFLDETVQTPGAKAQIQEYFGYCFYRKNDFDKCLLLLGPGADGKSTLLNILREIIGTENCSAISFGDLDDQFQRAALYQKMVNISAEINSKAVESARFKSLVSGDPQNAAFKHKNTFTYINYCKLIFATNKQPRVLDNSDGFFRRILPVSFKRQFLENDPDTDPFLEEKLLAEKSEIFHWALAGLNRLMKNKRFTQCGETDDLLMEYKRLNNPVICFCQDVCGIEEGKRTPKKDLFAVYEKYCRQNGYRAYSRENFFRELYAAHSTLRTYRPSASNPTRQYYIKGLYIKDYLS